MLAKKKKNNEIKLMAPWLQKALIYIIWISSSIAAGCATIGAMVMSVLMYVVIMGGDLVGIEAAGLVVFGLSAILFGLLEYFMIVKPMLRLFKKR